MQNMQIHSAFQAVKNNQLIQTEYNSLKYEESDFIMSFASMPLLRECRVISEALRNMFRINRFTEEYSSLLQEYISSEDYEKAMQEFHERTTQFEREPRMLSDAEIAIEAKILLSIIGEELDSEELAEIMNTDVFQTEYALRKYSKNKVEQQ